MHAVTDGLTAVSLNCLHRLLSHIRRLPSARRFPTADLPLAVGADPTVGDQITERVTVGSPVSGTARHLLAGIDQQPWVAGARVRVIRTEPTARTGPPRPRGSLVAVREVTVQLPLVVVWPGVAIVEDLPGTDGGDGLVVIRDQPYVDSLVACHDLMWSVAGVDDPGPRPSLPEHLDELLRELATGATDAQAARHLHVSDRTVSRHVAELLAVLGARSRLQAGLLAAHHGLV